MLKAVSSAFCILAVSGAAFAAETKPNDDMKGIESRISQTWHQPKVARRLSVSLKFTIEKSGKLKGAEVTKSSGDKAVDAAAVSAVKRAQPFAPLSGDYPEMSINYTFECRPDTNPVDSYKLNGVPIKDQGYKITGSGSTLRPLETHSNAEEYLANRAQQLGDKVVTLREKLEQQEKSSGADSPALIAPLSELANALKQLGQYDEADANFQRLIAIEEKAGDKKNLASALADYGDGFYRRSKYDAAEPLFTRAITLKRELGLSLSDVATLEEYAKLLYKLNRAAEAQTVYDDIKKLRAK